jgi:hypothetical protein
MNEEAPESQPELPSSAVDEKSASMREADTANGESPDSVEDRSSATPGRRRRDGTTPHPTGEQQARENIENDPPA